MEVGQRVVRGENWKWGNQDGGEGSVGTVVVLGKPGSLSSPDKTVIVQWDTGTKTNYRCGHQNAYDLYLLDNGPIGVSHIEPCCECNEQRIKGMLWQCAECHGYNICSTCYSNDKHSLEHRFYRKDTPNSIPVGMSKRQGRQKIQSQGTFTSAVVKRGPDWDWGNQDGGPHQKGLVTDVKGWDDQTFRSVVTVTWANSEGNVYRRGHKGKVDIISTTPSLGGYYYKDHLPKLGYPFPVSKGPARELPLACPAPPPPQYQFECGDKVRILLDVDILKLLQRDYGGCNARMESVIGIAGTIQSIAVNKNHGIVVKFPVSNNSAFKMIVNPLALSKVETFQVNDRVYILNSETLVRKLQAGHGEWADGMTHILGKEGKVLKIYYDGDIRVSIGSGSWTLNPAVLSKKTTNTAISPQGSKHPCPPVPSVTSLVSEIDLDDGNTTPKLILAAGQGNCSKVREIIYADPNKVNSSHQAGKTALHISSHEGHADVVNFLLNSRADCNIQDEDGDTALHYAAFGNKPQIVAALIHHGANMNIANKNGYTPLHVSVNRGHVNMVNSLIDAGCNLNLQDASGDTALHDAVTNDRQDIISMLIDSHRCDLTLVNQHGFSAFHRAALKGRQQVLEALLQESPALLNTAKDDGFTALHLSALNGHLGLVNFLLAQNGCNVNFVNDKHQTALLLAVDKSHKDIVKALLEHGADPNIQDDEGDTPLHTAAANHSFHGNTGDSSEAGIIHLLMQHQADPTLRNHDNKTAVNLCHDEEIASLMRNDVSLSFLHSNSPSQPLPAVPQEEKQPAVSMTTSDSCLLCSSPVDCEFQPCGHRVVCHGCSSMFKACCQCKTAVENVKKMDKPADNKCQLCSESEANVIFEPCLHKLVCSACCVRMKKCFVCQKTIHRKRTTDGTIINQEPEKYEQNMDSLVYLQARVREMEEAQNCVICMEHKRTVVFLCGHGTCDVCCQSLHDCPMCRTPIEKKIKLYS